jgi:hypothetical protein
MKVKELMNTLKTIDPNAEVYIGLLMLDMNGSIIKQSVLTVEDHKTDIVTNHISMIKNMGIIIYHVEKVSKSSELAMRQIN